jgi:hypothetical protein
MTLKTLSAIAIVTAALGSPAFAQDPALDGAAYHKQAYTRHFRNAYNQAPMSEPGYYVGPRSGGDWHGLDRSRVGDRDPDFNPSGS